MKIFRRHRRMREAQARMRAARAELAVPSAALLARGHKYPLGTVGAAVGAGFVMGQLDMHPLRVPGLGALLSGGLAEVVAHATRLLAELGDEAS
jgi:hypothetical protein